MNSDSNTARDLNNQQDETELALVNNGNIDDSHLEQEYQDLDITEVTNDVIEAVNKQLPTMTNTRSINSKRTLEEDIFFEDANLLIKGGYIIEKVIQLHAP
jgi:hypothetical protein